MTIPATEPSAPLEGVVEPPRAVTTTRTNPRTDTSGDDVFSKDDVERARQQEKDKVYSRLESEREKREALEARLRVFEEEREARLAAEEAARQEAENARKAQELAEMDNKTRLEQLEQEFQAKIAAMQQEREMERAINEQERALAQLEAYKARALADAQDDILPELWDDVRGNTQDEIDASITRLREKTASILNNTTAALQAQRRDTPGSRVTAPPVGPLEIETSTRRFSAAEIAAMTPSEYAQYRAQFGVGTSGTDRGMFG